MNTLLLRRFSMMGRMGNEYIQFEDPEVERICIANFSSDGIGVTYADAAAVTSLPVATFRGNTDIVTFNEFKYFTGLTTITAGSSTSATGAFGGCTALTSIEIPNSITTIGAYAFYNCSNLKNLIIPSTVTSIGNYAFYGLTSLDNLDVPFFNTSSIHTSISSTIGSADYNGDMIVRGNFTSSGTSHYLGFYFRFKTIYVYGNITSSNIYISYIIRGNCNLRVKGTVTNSMNSTSSAILYDSTHTFAEVIGNITSSKTTSRFGTATYLHLGYGGVISSTPTQMSIGTRPTNIYVGDGSSKSSDEAVLALYLADTNWSGQSAKLATWWDYNGEYKWYYVTDNLTKCTNTNPDAWPHITRGDSYHTQIVADEGYTLSSVQVHMYQCEDNTATPNTPTDITSQVYDASTGEINIEHVVGNVIITAVAS